MDYDIELLGSLCRRCNRTLAVKSLGCVSFWGWARSANDWTSMGVYTMRIFSHEFRFRLRWNGGCFSKLNTIWKNLARDEYSRLCSGEGNSDEPLYNVHVCHFLWIDVLLWLDGWYIASSCSVSSRNKPDILSFLSCSVSHVVSALKFFKHSVQRRYWPSPIISLLCLRFKSISCIR